VAVVIIQLWHFDDKFYIQHIHSRVIPGMYQVPGMANVHWCPKDAVPVLQQAVGPTPSSSTIVLLLFLIQQ